MTAVGSKCKVCKGPAVIDLPRHNAHFCAEHLQQLCRRQMAKAIDDFDMIQPDDRVLVAVSGGKDSLAVWDMLVEAGYRADGLYIGLGIGEYSDESGGYARRFAERAWLGAAGDRSARRLRLRRADGVAWRRGRVPCSACGLSKRHLFDQAALDGGYDVVVTGHNLDDEAAVLFGNTMRWDIDYLARQLPVLPARDGFPAQGQAARPPDRAGDRGVVRRARHRLPRRGVPDGRRATSTSATRRRSTRSRRGRPGAKAAFYLGFLDRMAPLLAGRRAAAVDGLHDVRTVRLADDRRRVRVLPAARQVAGHEPVARARWSPSGRGRR